MADGSMNSHAAWDEEWKTVLPLMVLDRQKVGPRLCRSRQGCDMVVPSAATLHRGNEISLVALCVMMYMLHSGVEGQGTCIATITSTMATTCSLFSRLFCWRGRSFPHAISFYYYYYVYLMRCDANASDCRNVAPGLGCRAWCTLSTFSSQNVVGPQLEQPEGRQVGDSGLRDLRPQPMQAWSYSPKGKRGTGLETETKSSRPNENGWQLPWK